MRRDPKGIYKRYEAGDTCQVAGLDLPVDEPVAPDLLIEYGPEQNYKTVVDELIKYVTSEG
ncbi:MAG: adenylyl-sulfate kinase [Bacteroidota bacterium]